MIVDGLLRRDGTGRKNDAYRFWLPEKDQAFAADVGEYFRQLARQDAAVIKGLGRGMG